MFKKLSGLIAIIALLAFAGSSAATAAGKQIVVLDKSLSQLRADFNANVGKVRMLYIPGPTCGVCLRGLSDLQESLYSKKGNDPRIVTYIVYVPTLGAREVNAADAASLITDTHTTNYWEESGIIGRRMQKTMKMDKYLWDFWVIYGPKAVWSDAETPPVPDFWQHQLDGLPTDKKLDANVFAAKVDELVARIPAPSTARK